MVGPQALLNTEEIKENMKIILLESFDETASSQNLENAEEYWRNTLSSWAPNGLNTREDGPSNLRRKRLIINNS